MDFSLVAGAAETVVDALQHLFKENLFTDFKIISKNKEFQVHQLILAIHSPVLSDIINETHCNSITIEDVSNSAIENMLRHFYGENVVIEDISDITETKKLADRYEILELGNICVEQLPQLPTDHSNVIYVLETAIEFQNKVKEEECLEIISENKESVFSSEQFKGMTFENASCLFQKLRDKNLITDYVFLHSFLQWMEINKNVDKKYLLLEKVNLSTLSMDEFLKIIIAFPEFLSNIEISDTVKNIMDEQKCSDTLAKTVKSHESESYRTIGVNAESDTGILGNADMEKNVENSKEHDCSQEERTKLKELILTRLTEEDSDNTFNCKLAVHLEIRDPMVSRNLRIALEDSLLKGTFGKLSQESPKYEFSGVGITYAGIHYMLSLLEGVHSTQYMTPSQYIEALKAALLFELKELADEMIEKIRSIDDYDPVFIDGLRRLEYFDDKCLHLIKSRTLGILLHPNIIKISSKLLILILQQEELALSSECPLLVAVITWLEAKNRYRWNFRFKLLNEIAFENIPTADFNYVLKFGEKFFSLEEKMSILNYKKADLHEAISLQKTLPTWYNFKSRKYSWPGMQ